MRRYENRDKELNEINTVIHEQNENISMNIELIKKIQTEIVTTQ